MSLGCKARKAAKNGQKASYEGGSCAFAEERTGLRG